VEVDRLIDWHAPWLAALRSMQPLCSHADWRTAMNEAAREHHIVSGYGLAVEFVGPGAAGAVPYELFIARTGQVPTRDNLHDRFNALMWLAYPLAKAALNARQAAAIERDGIGPVRGVVRDAATLIDESAVLLCYADGEVAAALVNHDWQRLLIAWRARWGRDIVALPFGHALLEKLAGPFKAITACVVPLHGMADPDAAAAAFIARPDLAPPLLPHLPVLGIPGWCADNADPRFYDDPRVFRPRRGSLCHSEPPARNLSATRDRDPSLRSG
jgi:hypothetical protein